MPVMMVLPWCANCAQYFGCECRCILFVLVSFFACVLCRYRSLYDALWMSLRFSFAAIATFAQIATASGFQLKALSHTQCKAASHLPASILFVQCT
jgi:hypothetical protein